MCIRDRYYLGDLVATQQNSCEFDGEMLTVQFRIHLGYHIEIDENKNFHIYKEE